MSRNSTQIEPIVIAIDLGSSLFKVMYTGQQGNPVPLALRPQLVSAVGADRIAAQMYEYGDDPFRSAWIEVDGMTYAGGEFAADLSGRQYHELSKWDDLLPRILIVLGLVADRLGIEAEFSAHVGLLLPRDEIHRPDRTERLQAITQAAAAFQFRGEPVACQLDLKVSTEGAGLFASHAVALEKSGVNPMRVDIPVVMLGERNTSVVLYRGGKINPALSSSDGPGFYQFAEMLKKSIGLPIALPDLIQAVFQKVDRVRVPGNQLVEIGELVPAVLEKYANAIQSHLKAKIPPGDVNVIIGGGGFYLISETIGPWLKNTDIAATYIGEALWHELQEIFGQYPDEFNLKMNRSLPARFADALGLHKAMSARLQQIQSSPLGR
jgi:hypothetical protein